jgi:hypothetical protein
MSNAAKALGLSRLPDMAERERPLSEQFRIVAKEWCDLDGAARMLEECKTATLSTMMKRLGDVPAAHSERDVKASPEWKEYLEKMVKTRTAANLKKVQLEFIRMKHQEWIASDANARAERRL